jgi:hypothetical protein
MSEWKIKTNKMKKCKSEQVLECNPVETLKTVAGAASEVR